MANMTHCGMCGSVSKGCEFPRQVGKHADRPLLKCRKVRTGNWSKTFIAKGKTASPRLVSCGACKQWEWNFNMKNHYMKTHSTIPMKKEDQNASAELTEKIAKKHLDAVKNMGERFPGAKDTVKKTKAKKKRVNPKSRLKKKPQKKASVKRSKKRKQSSATQTNKVKGSKKRKNPFDIPPGVVPSDASMFSMIPPPQEPTAALLQRPKKRKSPFDTASSKKKSQPPVKRQKNNGKESMTKEQLMQLLVPKKTAETKTTTVPPKKKQKLRRQRKERSFSESLDEVETDEETFFTDKRRKRVNRPLRTRKSTVSQSQKEWDEILRQCADKESDSDYSSE